MEQNCSEWLDLLHQRPQRKSGRYAPSPTGVLHLGNLQTAYAAFLQTQSQGIALILRIEDVDLPRNVEGSEEGIIEDLKALGIHWEEGPDLGGPCAPYTQSKRNMVYQKAIEFLKEKDLVFPCYCTRREIREAANAQQGMTTVYPGTCRNLSEEERAQQTRRPSWRFRVPSHSIYFEDGICDPLEQNLENAVGDFVLQRADGIYAYQLAVVVDDILMGVSEVLRGADLLESTPRQIALYEALEAPIPHFWHLPLLVDEEGEKYSKRNGAAGLRAYLSREGNSVESLIASFSQNLENEIRKLTQ